MLDLYNTPNIILLLLFIFIFVILSILGLYLFTLYIKLSNTETEFFTDTYVYITIASALIGVVIAFIIYNESQKFYMAQINVEEEASTLNTLYEMLSTLPNTKQIQKELLKYICYIINVEFPALYNGQIPNNMNTKLKLLIYNYKPQTIRETEIYQQCLITLNRAIYFRTARINSSINGLPNELWWVVLLGSIIVIVLTWFIHAVFLYKILMTSFIATIFASLIFLLVVQNYPFKGDFSIKSNAFKNILRELKLAIKCGGY